MIFKAVKLDLDFTDLISADYSQHCSSCITHQVDECKDIHKRFGGFPDSYTFENTKIHQLWWSNDHLDFDAIGNQLGIDVVTISTIKQPAGCVIPYHRDTFYRIKQLHINDNRPIVRANIYLEDYSMGQFLQYTYNDKLHTCVEWKAGDGFIWDTDVLHVGANAGFTPKYTMQVSGFLT